MAIRWYQRRGVLTIVNLVAVVLFCISIPMLIQQKDWLWVGLSSIALGFSASWLIWGRPEVPTA
jgi:hypothetical protein